MRRLSRLLAMSLGGLFALGLSSASAATGPVGTPMPGFTLRGLDGHAIGPADLKGKVVLIDLWATWCAPCLVSMPAIAKLQAEHRRDGLEVLAVSVDDDRKKLADYVARKPPGVTVVTPDPAFNHGYGVLLHLKGNAVVTPDKLIQANLPTWILVDRKGRIAAIHKASSEEPQVLAETVALVARR